MTPAGDWDLDADTVRRGALRWDRNGAGNVESADGSCQARPGTLGRGARLAARTAMEAVDAASSSSLQPTQARPPVQPRPPAQVRPPVQAQPRTVTIETPVRAERSGRAGQLRRAEAFRSYRRPCVTRSTRHAPALPHRFASTPVLSGMSLHWKFFLPCSPFPFP